MNSEKRDEHGNLCFEYTAKDLVRYRKKYKSHPLWIKDMPKRRRLRIITLVLFFGLSAAFSYWMWAGAFYPPGFGPLLASVFVWPLFAACIIQYKIHKSSCRSIISGWAACKLCFSKDGLIMDHIRWAEQNANTVQYSGNLVGIMPGYRNIFRNVMPYEKVTKAIFSSRQEQLMLRVTGGRQEVLSPSGEVVRTIGADNPNMTQYATVPVLPEHKDTILKILSDNISVPIEFPQEG